MQQKEHSSEGQKLTMLPFVVLVKAKREHQFVLPYELYLLIFRYLPVLQIPKLALVNRAFNQAKQRFFSEYEVRARQTFHEREPEKGRVDEVERVHSVKLAENAGFYFAAQLGLTDLDTRGPIACAINYSPNITVYDYKTGKPLCDFKGHSTQVEDLDGQVTAIAALTHNQVISADKQGMVYVWPIVEQKKLTGLKKFSRAAKEIPVVQQEYSYKLDSKVTSLDRVDDNTFMAATHNAIYIYNVSQAAPIKTIVPNIPMNMVRYVSVEEIYLLSHHMGEDREYHQDAVEVPAVIRVNQRPLWGKEVVWFPGIPMMDCFGTTSNCHMSLNSNGQALFLVNGYRSIFSQNETRSRSRETEYGFDELSDGVLFATRQGRVVNIDYKKNKLEIFDPKDIDYVVYKK